MASMRIGLNIGTFSAKPVGTTFTATLSLPTVETRPIRINSASFHGKYVRVYNKYCYLSFACGTASGYTNVFETSEGSAVSRDAGITITNAGNLLAENGRTITFTIETTRSNWSGNYFGVYSVQEFWIDVDYTVLESASTLTLNKASAEAGSAVTPAIKAGVGAGSHKVVWKLGGKSAQQTNAAAWTIPLAWLAEIPNALSGTASATLYTYNSAGAQIGSPSIAYFTVTVPASVVPSIESVTATGVNQTWGLYLKGRSQAKIAINGAAGAYGSAIARYQITGGGFSGSGASLATGTLNAPGTVTFTGTVWDSRGRSQSKSVSITVTDYSPPGITRAEARRCGADGSLMDTGTHIKAECGYNWSQAGSNAATVKIEYRQAGAASWTEAFSGAVSSPAEKVIGGGGISVQEIYEVRFTVTDALASSVTVQRVGTGYVFMRWDPANKALGLGCYPTGNNRLELGDDWEVWHKNQRLTDPEQIRFASGGKAGWDTILGKGNSFADEVLEAYDETNDRVIWRYLGNGSFWIGRPLSLSTALSVSYGGTGAKTAADATCNLIYSDVPLSLTTATDKPVNWPLGFRVTFYSPGKSTMYTPSSYGILWSFKYGNECSQLWFPLAAGPLFRRQGNNNGWSGSASATNYGWVKLANA